MCWVLLRNNARNARLLRLIKKSGAAFSVYLRVWNRRLGRWDLQITDESDQAVIDTGQSLIGQTLCDALPGHLDTLNDSGIPLIDTYLSVLNSRAPLSLDLEFKGEQAAGWYQVSVLPLSETELLIWWHNNTVQKRLEEKLRYQAQHDPLTGLLNRTGFETEVLAVNQNLWIAAIDIDGFRDVNDALGQRAGDALLIEFARFLESELSGAIVARSGGDEFWVALSVESEDDCRMVLSELCDRLSERAWEWEGKPLRIAVSIGVARLERI